MSAGENDGDTHSPLYEGLPKKNLHPHVEDAARHIGINDPNGTPKSNVPE